MAIKRCWRVMLFIFLNLEAFYVNVYGWHDEVSYSETSTPSASTYELNTTTTPSHPQITTCKEQHLLLNFSHMNLNRIGDDFASSEATSTLLLDNNQIEYVSPLAFRSLQRLETLDLSGNRIPLMNLLNYGNCPNLKTLILDNNNNNHHSNYENIIPMSYVKILPVLEVLSLQGNLIQSIKKEFMDFAPRLKKLYLSGNTMEMSDFFNDLPESLTHLYVERNRINGVEQGVTSNLVELAIDGNNIEKLCVESCYGSYFNLTGASKLQILRISENLIEDIEKGTFEHTPRLTYLDLSHNKIEALPHDTFDGAQEMEHLHLGYNHLSSIPDLCSLSNLRSLNLTGNVIASVHGNSFCSLPVLKSLVLSANRITTIESGAFDNFNSLEMLDLSHNNLIEFPHDWIRTSIPLWWLSLKNNGITSLDKLNIGPIATLEDLYLEGNPLTEIRIGSTRNYSENLLIHFGFLDARVERGNDYGMY